MNSKQRKKALGILVVCCLLCVLLSACHSRPAMDSLHSEWEKELQTASVNDIVDLSTIFPSDWDTVEIVNSPMGAAEFDWKAISDYDEEEASWLSSSETISALIFRQDGRIVDLIAYNYANPGSIVFRPNDHNGASDVSRYSREQAKFQLTRTGSFEERIFLHVS